ncbi:PH domain-like protein [Coniochaeta ligniaria NRRL 30616]|uniref:PH domain-like protein n=1 Tax=Coniochaeta ligniaria NRRL 30616 TaxID=1408157 RepID=A0A1J7IVL8_9PEZI|nr:PH domain-like protein [Coniochaeta ligniaria NRRL 30616]
MADDPQRGDSEPVTTKPAKEDAETTAARRELKQTYISDGGEKPEQTSQDSSEPSEDEAEQTTTPESKTKDAPHDDLKEQVSSPKKKRAHDQLDEQKDDTEDGAAVNPSTDKTNGTATLSRSDRSEPQKKRARDENSGDELSRPTSSSGPGATDKLSDTKNTAPSATSEKKDDKPQQTSASAFASSGFAKLASSTVSPFGTIAAPGKSVFGGGAPQSGFGGFAGGASQSPFSAAGPPKLSFASGSGSGAPTGATSPFGGLNGGQSSGFGSVLAGGNSFGSLLSGPKLGGFGKPGEVFKSDKPAKPFGAPDSEDEDGSEDDEDGEDGSGDEEGAENDDDKQKEKDKDEEHKAPSDDKKKPKLQKVVVDDGEAGEVTLLQVRAKMFLMEKGVGWKERGAGMLKVNVPQSSVEYDDYGAPRPETFDASVIDEDPMPDGSKGRKSVRLIMRQDHTLRVILNTVILPAMDFQLNQKLKASLVLFMAFDGPQVQQVQMKMSEVNANHFTNLMKTIQRELRDA